MSEHDEVRRLLPLAEAGATTPGEIRRVHEHLTSCASCRQANEDYALLGSTLRGLPTPQPSAELLARVRSLAAPMLTQKQAGSRDAAVLAPLIAASWIVALASWPWVRAAGMWMLTAWHVPGGSIAAALAAYSILGFLLAGASAIVAGCHAGAIGRMK